MTLTNIGASFLTLGPIFAVPTGFLDLTFLHVYTVAGGVILVAVIAGHWLYRKSVSREHLSLLLTNLGIGLMVYGIFFITMVVIFGIDEGISFIGFLTVTVPFVLLVAIGVMILLTGYLLGSSDILRVASMILSSLGLAFAFALGIVPFTILWAPALLVPIGIGVALLIIGYLLPRIVIGRKERKRDLEDLYAQLNRHTKEGHSSAK